MTLQEQMDEIYRHTPLDKIPWNLTKPPALLVDAVEQGIISPCRAIDLGCGAGNYAVWLAGKGFEMTGIDTSGEAVTHARRLAQKMETGCHFASEDLLGDLSAYRDYGFAYDWEVLHHIFPEDRLGYLRNVHQLLGNQGKYLSVCFSEQDKAFGGVGKIRETRLSTKLYFSSEDEMRALFEPLFRIDDLRTIQVEGKWEPHMVVATWMTKR
jgi:SAM-dependent methyltransferase